MTPLEKTDNFVKIMYQAIFCVTNSSSNTAVESKNERWIYLYGKMLAFQISLLQHIQTPGWAVLERPSKNLFNNYSNAKDIHEFKKIAKLWICFSSITK